LNADFLKSAFTFMAISKLKDVANKMKDSIVSQKKTNMDE